MKISIITVAFNAARTIADTLSSVAAQRLMLDGAALEHIVVDGGSGDDTLQIIQRHAAAHPDHPLTWISEPDRGLYDAMNKGVARASGDYIGFLNADDFYCRTDAVDRIATCANMTRPDAVAFDIAIVDEFVPDRVTRSYRATGFRPWMLTFGHMPPHPGFYASARSFEEVGPFSLGLRIGADFDWMTRFFCQHGLSAITGPATLVFLREGGLSTRGFASMRTINREASMAARRAGLSTHELLMWTKYLAKAVQLVRRPADFPLPASVRWQPRGSSVGV